MNERTRLVVAMSLAAVILFGWQPLLHVVEHATGWKLAYTPATQPADEPTTTQASDTAFASTQPGGAMTLSAASSQPAGALTLQAPTTRPDDVLIGSAGAKDKTYAMQMTVSPVGGGLAKVVLNDFTARVGSDDRFSFEHPYEDANVSALATTAVKINGVSQTLTGGIWHVEQTGDHTAVASLDLNDANQKPVLTLVKTYEILPREEGGANGALGFDTKFTYSFVNHSAAPLLVSSNFNGPVFPASEQARGGDRSVISGYQGKNSVVIRHDALESFNSAATKDYSTNDAGQFLWFGAEGNYFNGIVRPTGAPWVKIATAKAVNYAPEAEAHLREVALDIETVDLTIAPGATKTLDARVFFGPRKREILKNTYYSAMGVGYEHTLEIGGSSCSYCTFQWLIDFLMLLLGMFESVLRDWGLAIIALVFVVRACLHPITKKSQINMAGMSKMGPEIERIKKKFGDDKEGLNRAMMEFYKTQGTTPIFGCLPMFLQMPIWIALYSGLGSTFELRQAPFLYGFTWIKDLSQPDHLIKFAQPFNFFFLHFDGLNVIPILLAGAFFLQQKFTPKPPATTPEQQQQQKMMQWMTLLFPLMLYSSPSGLNLYIMTSTIFGIIESRIIRKHIKEREALAAVGPTFIDGDIVEPAKKPDAKPNKLTGWFARLQEMAEKARNDAEKKAQNKRR